MLKPSLSTVRILRKAGIILAAILALTISSIAQPGDPLTDPDTAVPITGIEYLLLGGGIMGGYKVWMAKRNKK